MPKAIQTPTTSTPRTLRHPDASLLGCCALYEQLDVQWNATFESQADDEAGDIAREPLGAAKLGLVDAICEASVVSLDGHQARARVFKRCFGEWSPEEAAYPANRLLIALVRDLVGEARS